MAEQAPIDLPDQRTPAGQTYVLVGISMLVAATVVLVTNYSDVWSVLPLAVGVIALLRQWRQGPPVVLVLIGLQLARSATLFGANPVEMLQSAFHNPAYYLADSWRENNIGPGDFVLAGAFLGYAIAHYRYLALTRTISPLEPQRNEASLAPVSRALPVPEEPSVRSTATVKPREFVWLFATIAASVGVAALVWSRAPPEEWPANRAAHVRWGATLICLLGVPLLLLRTALAYANQARASYGESLMYLQDQLWRETRREQARANRWMTWARLRAQRRKEKR